MTTTPLDLLRAGLRSHGFRLHADWAEAEGIQKWTRHGREPRWLSPEGRLLVGEMWGTSLDCGVDSDYHRLLSKCGSIQLRTDARWASQATPGVKPARQAKLQLDVDKLVEGL